jgi:GT2 family glycosyltransferase
VSRPADDGVEPLLSVVIVTLGRPQLLDSCLPSVQTALNEVDGSVEVLVIDNTPEGKVRDLGESRFPQVRFLSTRKNLGFAPAVMRGLHATRSAWVALLNDDLTVDRKAIAALLEAGRKDASVGAVAAQLRFADRPNLLNSAGIELDRLGVATDRLVGASVDQSEREPVEVFGASAGAALYRRSMLDELGGFDESFFAYLEDVDLAWRARMRGWRAVYAPDAVAYHQHSGTLGHGSAAKLFFVGRNRVRMLAKNATARHLRRHGLGIVAYDLAYVAFAGMRFRTLAPLRGRLTGLSEWRRYRQSGAASRRDIDLAAVVGLREALRRNRVWGGSSAPTREIRDKTNRA